MSAVYREMPLEIIYLTINDDATIYINYKNIFCKSSFNHIYYYVFVYMDDDMLEYTGLNIIYNIYMYICII